MDIKLLPASTKCLVDANILIHHLNGTSVECRDFLHRIARREIDAYLTTVIIAEVLHRQMLIEAVDRGFVSAGRAVRKLKDQPQIIEKLTDHITQVKRLLKLPFAVISVNVADISKSHQFRKRNHLFVNDSINLVCAKRVGIRHIVTHDSDFERVTGTTVWSPTDI